MFTPLHKILPAALRRIGVKREVEAAMVCEQYRSAAPLCVHKDALSHTFPKSYCGKILTVGVQNPAWAAQVASCQKMLTQAINKALGKSFVEQVRTKVVEKMIDFGRSIPLKSSR